MFKIKNRKFNQYAIIFSLILITAVSIGAYYAHKNFIVDKTQGSSSVEQIKQKGTDLSPATEADSARVNDNKQRIVDQQERDRQFAANQGANKRAIKPVITYAGINGTQVEVGGYADIFEEGGTCTATFVNGSSSLTKTVTAVRSAKSTDCPVMALPSSDFSRGSWSVTVTYNSSSASGTSEAREFKVT